MEFEDTIRAAYDEQMEVAKVCGCICHYRPTMHFRECCAATYFRVDQTFEQFYEYAMKIMSEK